MTKRLLWLGTAVMSTLLALALLWQFRLVVIYVLLSLMLAAALRPLIQRPAGQALALRLGLILLNLVVLVSVAFLLVATIGAAIGEIEELAVQGAAQDGWRQPAWLQDRSLQQWLDTRLPPPSQLFAALTGDQRELVLPAVLGITQGVFSLLSSTLIVLFLSLYWSVDQNHFERLWLSLLPPGQRRQMRAIWQTVESDLGVYIRSQAVQTLLAGLLLGLGYWLLGSPYPALLALIGALALLIPLVGVVLAVIPPLLLGLLGGAPLSLLTAVYAFVVVVSLKWWIQARLGHHNQVNPMLTLVILLALADAYGLAGILLAPPLAAVCQILWNHLVSDRAVNTAAVAGTDAVPTAAQFAALKERQEQAWRAVRLLEEPSPQVTSSMERLADLIEKAEPALNAITPVANGVDNQPTAPLRN
jgi:putative permease